MIILYFLNLFCLLFFKFWSKILCQHFNVWLCDSKSILVLPPTNIQIIEYEHLEAERDFYDAFFRCLKVTDAFLKDPCLLSSSITNHNFILIMLHMYNLLGENAINNAAYIVYANIQHVQFYQFMAQGKVLHNYASILELLLQLRQCCNHPFLVLRWEYSCRCY